MYRLAALALALVLSGCSTLGMPAGAPSSQSLDTLRGDVAGLIVAFDLPRGLGPAPGSLFMYDVATGGPAEHLRLQLQQADADAVAGNLPPPASGHAYYVFQLSEIDQQAVRNAQASAQARGVTAANVSVGVVPKLCTAGGLDPNAVTVSVIALVPGTRQTLPFMDRMPLAEVLRQPGSTQMPPCAQG